MFIRYAKPNDAPALSHLLVQTWKTAYRGIFPNHFLDNLQDDHWAAGFEKAISDPQASTLIYEIDKQIIAMVGFGKGRSLKFGTAEIYALNVLPSFQQQHIGSTLLNAALEKLAGERIYLQVAVENHKAQAFYYKHSFYNSQILQTRSLADFSFQEWIFQHSPVKRDLE